MISCGSDSGGPNPEITGIQPDSGPPGTMVTINGSGFSPEASNNSVSFGGTPAPVNSASESSIETQVPDGLSSGSVQIEVTVSDQTATGPGFMVEQSAPGISSVQPDSGTVGTSVTINGMNFSATASENTIEFNGTQAPVNSAAEDQLTTEVPQGATDGPITVTVKQKSSTGPDFDVITDGTLEVITKTSGDDQDSNGYEILLDGGNNTSAEVSDTVYFANLEEGDYQAEIDDIKVNCETQSQNQRRVTITAGDTTTTTFDVNCKAQIKNKIAYSTDVDGDDEISLISPTGMFSQLLTDNTEKDRYPVISNDGTRIAFVSHRSGDDELYIMDADGNNVTQLTTSMVGVQAASWSPDDSKIAFSSIHSGNYELYTVDVQTGDITRVTDDPADDEDPSWSPDGSKLAFTADRDGDTEIYTIEPDGSNVQRITDNSDAEGDPSWSPDGSKIAFYSSRDGNLEIYSMDADGSNPTRITLDSGSDSHPRWSPDGTELVFQTNRSGDFDILRINADGSGSASAVLDGSYSTLDPHWSPIE